MKLKNLFMAAMATVAIVPAANAEHLVICGTNDVHSQVDPASDGQGGVLRHRAIFDKVRSENKNVLVVSAGDVVQGNVYFSLYGGAVEYAALDSLGYDIIIMGNHEFDNNLDSTYYFYKDVKAEKVCTNLDLSRTKMAGLFMPYTTRLYGDKRVGFIGINVSPVGLISEKNYKGMTWIEADKIADPTAKYLKEVQKCDYVVMISHIGYIPDAPGMPCDPSVARNSRYIDFIVGGHSHTVVEPGSEENVVKNLDGKPVVIGQTGRWGKVVSKYDLDLETGKVTYDLIPVDSRWDEAAKKYTAMDNWIKPYRHGVDSLMTFPVAHSARKMKKSKAPLQNWTADASLDIIRQISGIDHVDLCIMNKGGIRIDMPEGVISEGVISSMFPFDNRYIVIEVTGQQLLDALNVMAKRDGDCVSDEIRAAYNDKGDITQAKFNGRKIDPKKIYNVATIDYLANGGDHMDSFKDAKRLFVDDVKYGIRVLKYVKDLEAAGKKIDGKNEERMVKK